MLLENVNGALVFVSKKEITKDKGSYRFCTLACPITYKNVTLFASRECDLNFTQGEMVLASFELGEYNGKVTINLSGLISK